MGAKLYSSRESGNRSLKIDKQDGEIGLHEALKKLGLGDKARFILPSHLAFGVAGDQQEVPPMTPLVYELKVVKIDKSKS
ncbi:MAG: FKBP-type peptidyl-prolyl cis-trans isomerase [Owenweeksia sp.]|nr:FKBP-type peptidyl-prolyl cis-trans isomerase [Owenweeksia sp.]